MQPNTPTTVFQNSTETDFRGPRKTPIRCKLNIKDAVLCVGHLYKPFQTIKTDWVGRGGQGRSKSAPEKALILLQSPPEAPKWVNDPQNGLKSINGLKCKSVPQIVLHLLCSTRTCWKHFWPSKVSFSSILVILGKGKYTTFTSLEGEWGGGHSEQTLAPEAIAFKSPCSAHSET